MKFLILLLAITKSLMISSQSKPSKFFMIVLENANADAVLRNPYFNHLTSIGLSLTNFHAQTHPSQGNYFAMITGDTFGISGAFGDRTVTLDVKSIADLLEAENKTWKTYQQGYPGSCSTASRVGAYARKHNPFISIKGIQNSTERCARIVNADELENDILNKSVPDYVFFTPDMNNDGHDTSIEYSAKWLQSFLDPLLANQYFDNTLFVVTFDENKYLYDHDDNRIYTVLLGSFVRGNTTDSTRYSHYSILAYLEALWGLGSLEKNDLSAPMFSL